MSCSVMGPRMGASLAPSALISAVYDFCRKLDAAGVLHSLHPAWGDHGGDMPDRSLLGWLDAPGCEREVQIHLGAARGVGRQRHEGRCPVCAPPGEGPLRLSLFDPGCAPLCPWQFPSRTAYVAHRMIPALAHATQRPTYDLYRVAGLRPPRLQVPPRPVTTLADALFGPT